MKDIYNQSAIGWCDLTWNPWWGCHKISEGCRNCYADAGSKRFGHDVWGLKAPRRFLSDDNWEKPLKWNMQAQLQGKRLRVFGGDMCDLFEDRPDLVGHRQLFWKLVNLTPCIDWQLCTKRPENILSMLPPDWGKGYPNIWMGTTIESNKYVHRADLLRAVPAVVRFISYEPALGPLEMLKLNGLDWLIYGGEQCFGFTQDETEWAKDIEARCKKAGVVFYYKQSSGNPGKVVKTLECKTIHDFPRARLPLLLV